MDDREQGRAKWARRVQDVEAQARELSDPFAAKGFSLRQRLEDDAVGVLLARWDTVGVTDRA